MYIVEAAKNPIILNESNNQYTLFTNKLYADINKTFNKVLNKYPDLKKLDLFTVEKEEYDEKKDYLNIISYDEWIIDEDDWNEFMKDGGQGDLKSSYVSENEELQNKLDKFINEVCKEINKLGYGKFEFEYSSEDGMFYLYNIKQSPKMKEYIKSKK